MKDSQFDALVADFYRAATGALEWEVALAGVQRAFRARAVLLHTLDYASGRLLKLDGGGPDLDDALLSYVREYHDIDPRRLIALQRGQADVGRWRHDHEDFDAAYVARNHFFQHYLPAYDTRYNSNLTIPVGGSVVTAFVLELPVARGPLDADEREMVRRLGEHMKEALLAHQRMRSLMAQALAGHTLLAGFAYPMWLIAADRFIEYENPAATRELEREDRVARRGLHLALTHGAADRQLTERLHTLGRAGHGAVELVDLRSNGADRPIWLHLSLLVPGSVLGAFGERPQVLATLFDPQQVSALDPFALANMFGLTPTEAKVAARLADGLSAGQIGDSLGTAQATVRSQVRQVIHKLGVTRAVDVVRLLRQGEALWAAADGAAAR